MGFERRLHRPCRRARSPHRPGTRDAGLRGALAARRKTIRAGANADRNGFLFITDLHKLTARDGNIAKPAGGAFGIYPFVRDISWATGWYLTTDRPMDVEGQRPPAPKDGETRGPTDEKDAGVFSG